MKSESANQKPPPDIPASERSNASSPEVGLETDVDQPVNTEEDKPQLDSATAELWGQIREHHRELNAAFRASVTHALCLGQKLVIVKSKTPHGQWLSSLSKNCSLDERQSQRYMQLFNQKALLAKVDPEWQTKYGIEEALNLLAKYEAEQSRSAIVASRASPPAGPTAQAASIVQPATKRSSAKVKAATLGELRSHLSSATKEISAVVKAVRAVDREETLAKIEEEAKKTQKECADLLNECAKRRSALQPKQTKSATSSKAATKDRATSMEDRPTAKSAKMATKQSGLAM
jgi:hypothetical protein